VRRREGGPIEEQEEECYDWVMYCVQNNMGVGAYQNSVGGGGKPQEGGDAYAYTYAYASGALPQGVIPRAGSCP